MKFMYDVYYFAFQARNIFEGGMARNNAFHNEFITLGVKIFNVYSKNKAERFWRLFKALILLQWLKKKKIFIHQGSILILFPVFLFRYKILRFFIKKFLLFIAKRNVLYIEVNDLPHEQAIDLQLPVDKSYIHIEDMLYSLIGVKFVFASHCMREFVCSKYKLSFDLTQVIINGGPELNKEQFTYNYAIFNNSKIIKYIYAGSLNKGRNIRNIINVFNNKESCLILIGNDGSWLTNEVLPDNVYYLGNFDEPEAHQITALCDIGLIPYDENKFYYNLCFPSKVSFYITAGIPVLSTKLKELQNVFKGSRNIKFVSFDDWNSFVENTAKEQVLTMKSEAIKLTDVFSWPAVINSLEL